MCAMSVLSRSTCSSLAALGLPSCVSLDQRLFPNDGRLLDDHVEYVTYHFSRIFCLSFPASHFRSHSCELLCLFQTGNGTLYLRHRELWNQIHLFHVEFVLAVRRIRGFCVHFGILHVRVLLFLWTRVLGFSACSLLFCYACSEAYTPPYYFAKMFATLPFHLLQMSCVVSVPFFLVLTLALFEMAAVNLTRMRCIFICLVILVHSLTLPLIVC